jgi:uncharacterized membrane protein YoaK (UPF0700 family)
MSASRVATIVSILVFFAGLFSGYVSQHPVLQQVLLGLLIISEALAEIPQIKSNSVSQLVVQIITAVLNKLVGKKAANAAS